MSATIEIPCVKFPEVPADLKITLPFGELKAFRDFAAGMPTDCNLTFNLLVQISPLLASMACLLKILKVVGAVEGLLKVVTNPLELPKKAAEVLEAIADMATCLPPLMFPNLFFMIKDILLLVINFLLCLISQLESILKFQAGIDLSSAEGNPVLTASLKCAQANAQTAAEHLAASVGPMQPLLDMISMIAEIVQLPITIPPLSAMFAPGADMAESVDKLKQAVEQLKQVVESIPG
jgi:hypothetical protein